MFRATETVSVARPAADAWAMLIDFPRVPAWESGVFEVRQTSSGNPGVGTTLVARRVYGARETVVDCRIVDWQQDRSVTMEVVGGPTRRALTTYAVEPVGDTACQVTFTVEGDMGPLLRWLDPLVAAAGRRLARTNLGALKSLVESGPAAR